MTGKKKSSEFKKIEKEIKQEISEVEGWIIQRRKFFIKLAKVIIFVLSPIFITTHLFHKKC